MGDVDAQGTATLLVNTPEGLRLAAARLGRATPFAKLDVQLRATRGYTIEAHGAALDITGFFEPEDDAVPDSPPAKKRKIATDDGAAKAVVPESPVKPKEPKQQPKSEAKVEAKPKTEVKSGKAEQVEAKKPEAKKPEAKKPEVKKPEAKAAAAPPASAKPSGPPKGPQQLAGGLMYEVVKAGNANGPKAVRGKKVHVRYEGRLASNGKRFDKGTIPFKLGAGDVIRGWDLGVAGMAVGEKRKLRIPPGLAYGNRGAPPDIPPNATLAFEVELMKVM